MNGVLIAFLIFVIVFAIYMVFRMYDPSYLIRDSVSINILNSGKTEQYSISADYIDNPGSSRYFYEGWFYINANEPIKTANVLFNRGDNFIVALTGSTLNLYTNANLPSGKRVSSVGVLDTSGISPFMSIPNLPIQKWCQIVINVDGMAVDIYIDGKFVKNSQTTIPISVNTTDSITYGNHYTLGYVAKFRRLDKNINPQGVWNSYMYGSGQNMSANDYHVNAQITKNNKVRIDQRII